MKLYVPLESKTASSTFLVDCRCSFLAIFCISSHDLGKIICIDTNTARRSKFSSAKRLWSGSSRSILTGFVNWGKVVMEGRQVLQGDFRGLTVCLAEKLPIQAVSACREGWPQWLFTSEHLPLDRGFLAFAALVLTCLKVYLHEWVQTTICSPCPSSTKTTCSLEATESFNVILRLPLHLKSLILVGYRAPFHLVVRDEGWGAQLV